MKNTLIILCFLIFALCTAQNEKVNREAFTLKLAIDTEHDYSMKVESTPYFVKERIMQIYPSEKLFIETEIKGDTIYSMKVVTKNTHPDKTIEIEFSEDAKDRNNITSMLIVTNPFNKTLRYNALMYTPISQKWKETSILAIRPKLQNFETWPHAIITLVLEQWRLE